MLSSKPIGLLALCALLISSVAPSPALAEPPSLVGVAPSAGERMRMLHAVVKVLGPGFAVMPFPDEQAELSALGSGKLALALISPDRCANTKPKKTVSVAELGMESLFAVERVSAGSLIKKFDGGEPSGVLLVTVSSEPLPQHVQKLLAEELGATRGKLTQKQARDAEEALQLLKEPGAVLAVYGPQPVRWLREAMTGNESIIPVRWLKPAAKVPPPAGGDEPGEAAPPDDADTPKGCGYSETTILPEFYPAIPLEGYVTVGMRVGLYRGAKGGEGVSAGLLELLDEKKGELTSAHPSMYDFVP